jgi:hypothetical protein
MTASNPRYFYTDPLAAAWMAKHFGMRFVNTNNGADIGLGDIITHAQTGNYCHINIHPDSLPLLTPMAGDVLMRDGLQEHITAHNIYLFVHRAPDTEHLFEGFHEKGGMIIQRNGLPFHWPQQEPAA